MGKGSSARIRIGVAGWDYRDWRGTVYPAPRPRGFDPLRYLARYLDLIEINSTFYGPARAAVAEQWVARVEDAPAFRFTAKLWRRFTHERTAAWTKQEVREARAAFDVLQRRERLDAVLIQFPWSFRNDETNAEWLADVAAAFDAFPLVVEVRHESWNTPEFLQWLTERRIGFVNLDQPLFRRSIRPSAHVTAPVAYIRVHGRNYSDWFRRNAGRDARYDYLYDPDELRPWAKRARAAAAEAASESVDVVFNNHYRGQAVVNALQFRKLVERRQPAAPPALAAAYAGELAGFARADDAPEPGA
jgi:uncharacterized protein YecE (DUF72 family)